jgi:hypothetical protein
MKDFPEDPQIDDQEKGGHTYSPEKVTLPAASGAPLMPVCVANNLSPLAPVYSAVPLRVGGVVLKSTIWLLETILLPKCENLPVP